MRATQTLSVDFQKLQRTGPTGILVLRLMRAANDLALANAGYRRYRQPGPPLEEHIRAGARQYFVRLQCGHLAEALPLVTKVRHNSPLKALLSRCTDDAQAAFRRLLECVKGGSQHEEFRKYVQRIRNKVAFHYDPKPIRKALADRASRTETRYSIITRGTNVDLWRFNAADDIEVSVVARQLWEIPRGADLEAEDDRISLFGSNLCRDFIQFSAALSDRFIQQHALAG